MVDNFGVRELIWLVLSFVLPPLAIFIRNDQLNVHVCLSIVLLFIFWLPAVIHSLWYCFFRSDSYTPPTEQEKA
ncbi:unnamed protein product [Bursaphelenchus okinawaensis]|uniref:Uncharacterized protein n=1 Tax=Bursaphelenchus okinawaensis TaxID=465554 RepID=A0A811K7K3_9BILA|nr:unnamed protein product [Bursaphelenchus okinawaensis]CAG9094253.1 unnamed protein product [Bursaphelenchus okinawaensis]